MVALIDAGAGAGQVARATMEAAQRGLANAASDKGLVAVISLLMNLPSAARDGDFSTGLSELGIELDGAPTLMQITGAISDLLDSEVANSGRTDLSEMAQMAAIETIAQTLGGNTQSLFGVTPTDVQREMGRLSKVREFGVFMRDFFSRLTERYLGYFLSRELTYHVGEGRRFTTLAQQAEFNKGLALHCSEASKIVETFSGQWRSKTQWETGSLAHKEVRKFTHGAVSKLSAELVKGVG